MRSKHNFRKILRPVRIMPFTKHVKDMDPGLFDEILGNKEVKRLLDKGDRLMEPRMRLLSCQKCAAVPGAAVAYVLFIT